MALGALRESENSSEGEQSQNDWGQHIDQEMERVLYNLQIMTQDRDNWRRDAHSIGYLREEIDLLRRGYVLFQAGHRRTAHELDTLSRQVPKIQVEVSRTIARVRVQFSDTLDRTIEILDAVQQSRREIEATIADLRAHLLAEMRTELMADFQANIRDDVRAEIVADLMAELLPQIQANRPQQGQFDGENQVSPPPRQRPSSKSGTSNTTCSSSESGGAEPVAIGSRTRLSTKEAATLRVSSLTMSQPSGTDIDSFPTLVNPDRSRSRSRPSSRPHSASHPSDVMRGVWDHTLRSPRTSTASNIEGMNNTSEIPQVSPEANARCISSTPRILERRRTRQQRQTLNGRPTIRSSVPISLLSDEENHSPRAAKRAKSGR